MSRFSGLAQERRNAALARRTVVQPLESRVLLSAALLSDIKLVGLPSNPSVLAQVNGTLNFKVNDGTYGYELRTSDGTSAGTVPPDSMCCLMGTI